MFCCCLDEEEEEKPGIMTKNTDHSLHANMLRESKDDVFKKFQVSEVLGQGSMGSVCKVRIKKGKIGGSAYQTKKRGFFSCCRPNEKQDKKLQKSNHDYYYALKSIQLDRVSPMFIQELQNEIDILRSMDHPNIVKAHEVYTYKRQIYLVLELCDGGDLYTRQPYSEREAAKIVSKLLSAVKYMHDHNIVHRDLKFENIMFEDDSDDAEIKVIDFGLSKKFLGQPGFMTDRVGTIYTMAPQVLQGIYSSKADLWSVGVIAYMLLSASKPFYHKRRRKMVDLIMRGDYDFLMPVWEQISSSAKDFVDKLLVVDPKFRMDATEALKHEWIVKRSQLPDEKPSEDLLAAVDDCLLNYKESSALKKLALNVIAHRSTTDEILQLRKAFDAYDSSNDGVITFAEFNEALKKMNYSDETLQEIFSSIDVNHNGHIQYTEFLAATIEAHGHIEEDRIAEAFDRLDSDDTGFISKENLREVLGADGTPELIDGLIREADKNNDGRISYQEFLVFFRTQTDALADEVAQPMHESLHESETNLVGLDAKIPGGRYDSKLSPSLKEQADKVDEAEQLASRRLGA